MSENDKKSIFFKPKQSIFIEIPESPLVYWIREIFLQILQNPDHLSDYADVRQGIGCADSNRFIRNFWETTAIKGWFPYARGGKYQKWSNLIFSSVDWRFNGVRIKQSKSIIPSEHRYFQEGLTYTDLACGSMSTRYLPKDHIFSDGGPGIFSTEENLWILNLLNSNLMTYFLRISCSSPLHFRMGYVARLPLPQKKPTALSEISKLCISLKESCCKKNITEYDFNGSINKDDVDWIAITNLLVLESYSVNFVNKCYNLEKEDIEQIYNETGAPAGFYPLISNYDKLPQLSEKFSQLPIEVIASLNIHQHITVSSEKLFTINKRLRSFYGEGVGIKKNEEVCEVTTSDDDESLALGAHIPIPAETFLEELSRKMEIHPVTVYWLLKEGIEKEGWKCIPEEKRYNEDLFTVIVLRLLGHHWPKQIEAGEPVPEWVDPDGIIPITGGLAHPTLLQQVRDRIAVEIPGGKVYEIEKEFENVVGMTLERWLAGEFFKHHISQYRKRPIAWQLSSSPSGTGTGKSKGRGSRREPAFSCLVYYHKIDADILHKIRTQYVGDLINRYETELRALEGRKELTADQATRKVQLENWTVELKDFAQALQDVADHGFDSKTLKNIIEKEQLDKWTSRDGKMLPPKTVQEFDAQEGRYDPDINDGVRVNIAPLQKAGLFSDEVIAKKDVEKAITDRAEWRADERRWCREGKLPKCGWWD
jgi:hypothetical protein